MLTLQLVSTAPAAISVSSSVNVAEKPLLDSMFALAIRCSMTPTLSNVNLLWVINSTNQLLRWRSFAVQPLLYKRSYSHLKRRAHQHTSIIYGNQEVESTQCGFHSDHMEKRLGNFPLLSHFTPSNIVQKRDSATSTNISKSHVLVATWTTLSNLFEPYAGTNQSVELLRDWWVTGSPQAQLFCRNYSASNPQADVELRLCQYLGLPATQAHPERYWVEFWILPEDLERPCLKPDVQLFTCDLSSMVGNVNGDLSVDAISIENSNSTGGIRQQFQNISSWLHDWQQQNAENSPVLRLQSHITWFEQMATAPATYNYVRPSSNSFPWTRLGYTFDWGAESQQGSDNGKGVGATEFIALKGARIYVESIQSTADYCRA